MLAKERGQVRLHDLEVVWVEGLIFDRRASTQNQLSDTESMPQENRYIIIREDLVQDPVTIITDGLLIGRLLECELLLNHPAVSRAQAGIKLVDGSYFLFSLGPS